MPGKKKARDSVDARAPGPYRGICGARVVIIGAFAASCSQPAAPPPHERWLFVLRGRIRSRVASKLRAAPGIAVAARAQGVDARVELWMDAWVLPCWARPLSAALSSPAVLNIFCRPPPPAVSCRRVTATAAPRGTDETVPAEFICVSLSLSLSRIPSSPVNSCCRVKPCGHVVRT